MSSFDKYRVHEVAKDFGLPSKNITEILTKYATTPKNHMQVLEDSELSVIFEYLTQQHQCATMEDMVRVPAVEKKPEPKKEQPAPQAKPAQEPARAQSAAPAEVAQQPAQPKKEKQHVPRQVPEKRVIDTRGGGNVNLGKYDERFDRMAGAHGADSGRQRGGKEKFSNKQKQRQQQAAASAKRRAEER